MPSQPPPARKPLNPPRLDGDDGAPPPPIPDGRRRWPRRLLLGLLVLVAFLVAWTGLSALLLSARLDRIPAAELVSLDETGNGPVNYLLVGSDSRENLPPEFGDWFGDFGGRRADVIIVLHESGGVVQMLSLPRDLKVDIPGVGVNRINAAYAFGGPDLLVRTVKAATGLPIHNYLEVGFSEFAAVVDEIGGVSIEFPYAARDNKSGLSVEAGTTTLNGVQTVAFVRSRTYEELQGGVWVGVDQGDIARTRRQQLVVAKLLSSAKSPMNLIKSPMMAASVGDALTANDGLSIVDIGRLGWAMARHGEIESATLPVIDSLEGGVAYVVRSEPAASDLIEAFTLAQPLP